MKRFLQGFVLAVLARFGKAMLERSAENRKERQLLAQTTAAGSPARARPRSTPGRRRGAARSTRPGPASGGTPIPRGRLHVKSRSRVPLAQPDF